MGKVESIIKSEIVRLAKREMRQNFVPLSREVRSLKITISQLRKAVQGLQRLAAWMKNGMRLMRQSWVTSLGGTLRDVECQRLSTWPSK